MDPVQIQQPSVSSSSCCGHCPGGGVKKHFLVILVVVFLILFWQWVSSPMIVTVTGIGEVSVPATSATLSLSVVSTDSSTQAAIASVKAKALAMRQAFKGSGISEEDISESQLTVVPSSLVAAGSTGFQTQITMSAKTVHITSVSDLISSLYSQGASVVSQPVLSVDKIDELEAKAMDEAMTNAKKEASKISLKNWKFIKKVAAITQQDSTQTSTSTSKADTLTEANSQQAAQNGVFKIAKAVSVSYRMW